MLKASIEKKGHLGKSGGDSATPHVIAGCDLKPSNKVSSNGASTVDHEVVDGFVGSGLALKEDNGKEYCGKSGASLKADLKEFEGDPSTLPIEKIEDKPPFFRAEGEKICMAFKSGSSVDLLTVMLSPTNSTGRYVASSNIELDTPEVRLHQLSIICS